MLYANTRLVRFFAITLLSLYLNQTTLAQGRRIYVDAFNTAKETSGSSWHEALTNLEDALDLAQPGDSIWISIGIYKPLKNNHFKLYNDVKIFGGFSGVESNVHQRDWRHFRVIFTTTEQHILHIEGNGEGAEIDGIIFQFEKKNAPRSFSDPQCFTGFEPSIVAAEKTNFTVVRNCSFDHLTANLFQQRYKAGAHHDSTKVIGAGKTSHLVLQAPAKQKLGELRYAIFDEKNHAVLNGRVALADHKSIEIIVLERFKSGTYTLEVKDDTGGAMMLKQFWIGK